MHLHPLIYRRLARIAVGSKNSRDKRRGNNLIVLYIYTGAALFTFPALLVWKSTPTLAALGLAYWAAYLWLYFRLARWRAPAWMIISPKKHVIREPSAVSRQPSNTDRQLLAVSFQPSETADCNLKAVSRQFSAVRNCRLQSQGGQPSVFSRQRNNLAPIR